MFGVTHLLEASVRRMGSITGRRVCKLVQGNNGALLVETIIAVLVFSIVGSAVLVGLSTTHTSGARTKSQSTAENIARNQMEYMFSLPYQDPPSTCPLVEAPEGTTVTCTIEEYVLGDPNIEKVVVTVTSNGQEQLSLESLRAK